jgi:hypothetical protein
MAQRIVDKADVWEVVSAEATAKRHKLLEQVEAITEETPDVETELANISWESA